MDCNLAKQLLPIERWLGRVDDVIAKDKDAYAANDLLGSRRILCSGSHPDTCCAGPASMMTTIGVFTVLPGRKLRQVAPSLMGGASQPGDKYDPAGRLLRGEGGHRFVGLDSPLGWDRHADSRLNARSDNGSNLN